jgi:hypothetical protein
MAVKRVFGASMPRHTRLLAAGSFDVGYPLW